VADTLPFAVDVFRMICDRLTTKKADLRSMIETKTSFEEWLAWEAYLACKPRQADYPFCEVTAKPTYASEGIADDGHAEHLLGDLRVGAAFDADDHRWLFAEIALLRDDNHNDWQRKLEEDSNKLLRLNWRHSTSLLLVIVASHSDVPTELSFWNSPPLTKSFVLNLPEGGSIIAMAFDIKKDPSHILHSEAEV
jgi:hypothetical protein